MNSIKAIRIVKTLDHTSFSVNHYGNLALIIDSRKLPMIDRALRLNGYDFQILNTNGDRLIVLNIPYPFVTPLDTD